MYDPVDNSISNDMKPKHPFSVYLFIYLFE